MLITIAKRTGLVDYLRSAVKRDAREALKPVQHDLGALQGQLAAIQKQLRQVETTLAELTERSARGERIALQAKSVLRLDSAHHDLVAQLDTLLDEPAIGRHVRQAIAAAALHLDPYPHIV